MIVAYMDWWYGKKDRSLSKFFLPETYDFPQDMDEMSNKISPCRL